MRNQHLDLGARCPRGSRRRGSAPARRRPSRAARARARPRNSSIPNAATCARPRRGRCRGRSAARIRSGVPSASAKRASARPTSASAPAGKRAAQIRLGDHAAERAIVVAQRPPRPGSRMPFSVTDCSRRTKTGAARDRFSFDVEELAHLIELEPERGAQRQLGLGVKADRIEHLETGAAEHARQMANQIPGGRGRRYGRAWCSAGGSGRRRIG